MYTSETLLTIGGSGLLCRVAGGQLDVLESPAFRAFASSGRVDVTLDFHLDGIPAGLTDGSAPCFDSGGAWQLFSRPGEIIFLHHLLPPDPPTPLIVAVFRDDFREGVVYADSARHPEIDPFGYPLAEILLICLASRGRGLLMHACGIDDGGRGYLFTGNSTHGKSTMARLWQQRDASILNDDRVLVCKSGDGYCLYGTPWHGDVALVSSLVVPLSRVFFLRHGESNAIRPQSRISATGMLMQRCFPPFWDKSGMDFTLAFCAELAAGVPCEELSFVPDRQVVDFVRRQA
jgi:hypothetical protein